MNIYIHRWLTIMKLKRKLKRENTNILFVGFIPDLVKL